LLVVESGGSSADVAMNRYADGDDAAFAEVYDTVAPRVYAYLRRNTRRGETAEDVVQQTLLQIHRARGTFIRGSAVLPWAFAIARRLLIDEVRRDRRNVLIGAGDVEEDAVADPAYSGEFVAEARELAHALQREFDRLPETQRAAFELMRIDGLSHIEAAAVLGATVNAVKLRAHRAYESLRRAMANVGDEATNPEES
jgi:RNA polymerase sigma-70 factor (ECF subfamily)